MDKTAYLFKALGDPSRLAILKTLHNRPCHVELIAEITSLSEGTVSFHLKKLENAKLVSSKKEQYYRVYSLLPQKFKQSLAELIDLSVDKKVENAASSFRKKVLKAFYVHGKLKSIPVQTKKRIVILEMLANQFKRNKVYPEKEVNRILLEVHEDFCTLRRELISQKLLKRKNGLYERV